MASCIIPEHSAEYQALKKKSGLSDFELLAKVRPFVDKYGRYPFLDEIKGSNSEPYLREHLEMKGDGAKIETILERTVSQSVEEAVVKINDDLRDIEVSVTPLNKEAIISVEHRPTSYNEEEPEVLEYDDNVSSKTLLNQSIEKLARLYGVGIIPITTPELMTEEWRGLVPEAKNTNAFVYNGNIYINTDVASIDAPLHEMMHLFIGSIRFTNPNLYSQLLNLSQNFEDYPDMILEMQGRTRNDINEEIMVREFSKYLVGEPSQFDKIDDTIKYEIFYNMNRIFDSVLMGHDSVNTIGKEKLGNLTLRDLAKKVNSALIINKFHGSLDDMSIHRIAMNTKAQLMKEGRLLEECL